MADILDKEKISTTEMKVNELDQSNQPLHCAIWKPPPWLILKVNSDDAIFREQNSVGVGVVIRDIKGQGVAFMDEKITLFLVMVWKIWTHWNRVRTNQPCCSPNQLANMAKRTPNGIPGGATTFSTTVHTDPSSLESSYLGHGKGQF